MQNSHNRHINKGFGAVCGLLRGVCTISRSDRPRYNKIPALASGWGTGFPETVQGLRSFQFMTLVVCLSFGSPLFADFNNASWSSSGDFSLSNSFSGSSAWSPPTNQWTALDSFELSRPALGPSPAPRIVIGNGSQLDKLLDVIASAEAGSKGYDAIHFSATRLPSKPPSQLTIGEIFAWIRATPGQHHAIGRYQFIPSTLAYLVEVEGIRSSAVFTAKLKCHPSAIQECHSRLQR